MNHTQSFWFLCFSAFWMGWNVLLALVPIVLAQYLLKIRSRITELFIMGLWIVFLPNTLYMITDVIHAFSYRFSTMTKPFWIIGIVLYACIIALAVYTFILALLPVINKYQKNINLLSTGAKVTVLGSLSLLVGLAIAMGRFQRTNSWYIFTQPSRVIGDIVQSLTDPIVVFVAMCYSIGACMIIVITYRASR